MSAEYSYRETEDFLKCCKKLKDETKASRIKVGLEKQAKFGIRRQPVKTNKIIHRSPNGLYEIWSQRLPDPDANKGKSSAFRMIYILDLEVNAFYADVFFSRDDLDHRGSSGKKQKSWDKRVEDLKKLIQTESVRLNELCVGENVHEISNFLDLDNL